MTIQLNADKNLNIHESFGEKMKETLEHDLNRFSDYITRLEVHLSDENGGKDGVNDKRCLLEARLQGMQPVAVKNTGNTYDFAVEGAVSKLKTSLDTIIGRSKHH